MANIAIHASKVIDGLLYDTKDALVVVEGRYETLFTTRNNNFFIGFHGSYGDDDREYRKIEKLADPSEWIFKHCDGATAVRLVRNLLGLEVARA